MNTIEQNIKRIIDQEIFTNASTMVADLSTADLSETMPNLCELLTACSVSDDWETPVRDALSDITPGGLADVCGFLGVDLQTKDGEIVTDEMAETIDHDAVDRSAVIAHIEESNQWSEVGEYLSLDPETIEALQHWLVSDWLAERLERIGALISQDVLGFNIWGRTDCGQSLEMNSDLRKVAELVERDLQDIMGRD